MGLMQRRKGKVGEREVVALIRAAGFEAERGQQYRGGSDSPDVVHNMRDLRPSGHSMFAEVKRREQVNLYSTLDQMRSEMDAGDTPVIFHRKNGKEWLVTLPAEEFLDILYTMHNCTGAP